MAGHANGNAYQRDRGDADHPRDTQVGQARAGQWPTAQASDGTRGPESRETKDARGSGGICQPEAVRAASWQTSVRMDSEQSGSGARGPSQTSQVRESEWATCLGAGGGSVSRGGDHKHEELQGGQVQSAEWHTPQARDWKDTSATQGSRKSPNLGTQANAACPSAGPTPDGA